MTAYPRPPILGCLSKGTYERTHIYGFREERSSKDRLQGSLVFLHFYKIVSEKRLFIAQYAMSVKEVRPRAGIGGQEDNTFLDSIVDP